MFSFHSISIKETEVVSVEKQRLPFWSVPPLGLGLTDVVVLLAHVELVAQREGAVTLKLLRELDGSVGGVGPVALPALEALLGVAHAVAAVTDHVQDVLLGHGALQRPPRSDVVMRAVDVQVVIDADLHRVPLPPKAETHRADGIMANVIFHQLVPDMLMLY